MPVYVMQCDTCGDREEIFRTVARMNEDLPVCCGEAKHRVICAPFVMNDITPYKSVITGEPITSRNQHHAHLRKHKMVELGNEMPKAFKAPNVSADLRQDLKPIVDKLAKFD